MSIKNKLFEDIIAVTGGIFSTCMKANAKIANDMKAKFNFHNQKSFVTHEEYEKLMEIIADLKSKQEILSSKLENIVSKNKIKD